MHANKTTIDAVRSELSKSFVYVFVPVCKWRCSGVRFAKGFSFHRVSTETGHRTDSFTESENTVGIGGPPGA